MQVQEKLWFLGGKIRILFFEILYIYIFFYFV